MHDELIMQLGGVALTSVHSELSDFKVSTSSLGFDNLTIS